MMKSILEFQAKLNKIDATDHTISKEKTFSIQQELERPYPIVFLDSNKEKISVSLGVYGNIPDLDKRDAKVYIKPLEANKDIIIEDKFNLQDLEYISNLFKMQLKDIIFMGRKKTITDLSHVNELYKSPAYLVYIENKINTYIMIYFQRWSHPSQPRGAGEDQYGEDNTYVHGIWENPKLPFSIQNKIKK